MHELKAIIFDMDGTLADTEDIHRLAFNQAFSEYEFGWQWSVEEYKQLLSISGGKERIRNYLQEQNVVPQDQEDLLQLSQSVHKRKSDIYREMLVAGHIQLRQGVKRLIEDAISKNITLAIATSSSRKNVETLLQNALGENTLSLFSVIVTSDLVENKKPSPAVYQYALAELGLKPENCIALEDTYNGNKAAIDAKLKTVITTNIYTLDDNFSQASLVIQQLGEPEQAFTLQYGNSFGKQFVDVELLQCICSDDASSHAKSDWSSNQVAVAST
ncbi:MAG: HAD superfamily hydrolase (TIGR01509 family) [Gammaproteobacteria bacterium]|jgi:HAD superfamily hydrolase (TIGR01509 family)